MDNCSSLLAVLYITNSSPVTEFPSNLYSLNKKLILLFSDSVVLLLFSQKLLVVVSCKKLEGRRFEEEMMPHYRREVKSSKGIRLEEGLMSH